MKEIIHFDALKEVFWLPPLLPWIKVNTDGAANSVNASSGGIFINSQGVCIGCFAQLLGPVNALHAELSAAMTAIELAYDYGFNYLWLESDSQLVIQAFKSINVVP